MLVNIIMFFTMYPVLLVLYFCFRGQYQYADGCLFAVNMKPEWIKEPEVAAIVEKFRREMKQYFIFLLIVPLSSFLTKHMSIQLTIWMMWILIAIVLLCLPLVHANSGLKRWKTEHCLYETEKTEHRIELKAVGKVRRVNFLPFFQCPFCQFFQKDPIRIFIIDGTPLIFQLITDCFHAKLHLLTCSRIKTLKICKILHRTAIPP